jgi:subtilisin family serine protease
VAVLDTGVLATHATFAPGQIVAWYDFTHAGPTDPGTAWDATVAPYDDNGHGTAVASMIGGTSGRQTPSHAPGVRLAVAKISQKDGSATWETVHRAMRWAVNVAHADVISLSFYTYVPTPGSGTELLSALREARSAGALPVVLAGNGLGNVGIPTESWLGAPGASRAALVVGGSRADGSPVAPLGSMDPEVTALYDVTAACPKGDACYAQESGTSFSTPLVAGIAARALDAARTRGGAPVGPDELEWQIKACASDTNAPPDLEGYGVMDASAAACVVQHALRGSMTRPDPNSPNALYVEQVEGTERASSPAG